ARRLRVRLDQYFEGPGRGDPVTIQIPKGHYVAVFRRNGESLIQSAGDDTEPVGNSILERLADTQDAPASSKPASLPGRVRWRPPLYATAVVAVLAVVAAVVTTQRETTARLENSRVGLGQLDLVTQNTVTERFSKGLTATMHRVLGQSGIQVVSSKTG